MSALWKRHRGSKFCIERRSFEGRLDVARPSVCARPSGTEMSFRPRVLKAITITRQSKRVAETAYYGRTCRRQRPKARSREVELSPLCLALHTRYGKRIRAAVGHCVGGDILETSYLSAYADWNRRSRSAGIITLLVSDTMASQLALLCHRSFKLLLSATERRIQVRPHGFS